MPRADSKNKETRDTVDNGEGLLGTAKRPGSQRAEGESAQAVLTTDAQANFREMMIDYGVPQQTAEVIAKNIADTGSDRVFYRPDELLEKLTGFHREIPPYTRRQMLTHWVTLNDLPKPKDFDVAMGETPERIKQMKTGEKFTVDKDGSILPATNDTAMPLTMDEAERVSQKIKDDKAAQRKHDEEAEIKKRRDEEDAETRKIKAEADAKTAGVPHVIQDQQTGEWTPNPNDPHPTGNEPLMCWALNQARAKGDTRPAGDIIKEEVEKIKLLAPLAGLKPEGGGGGSTNDVITAIRTGIELAGGNKGADPVILQRMEAQEKALLALQEQNRLLAQQLADNKEKVLLDTIAKMAEDAKSREEKLRSEIATAFEAVKAQNGSITEIGVLNNALNKAHEGAQHTLDSVVSLVRAATGKAPPPMDESTRKAITEGVGRVLNQDKHLAELAAKAGLPK